MKTMTECKKPLADTTMPSGRSIKLDRQCPRCTKRLYHLYSAAKRKCYCSNCGHEWHARVMARDV